MKQAMIDIRLLINETSNLVNSLTMNRDAIISSNQQNFKIDGINFYTKDSAKSYLAGKITAYLEMGDRLKELIK